MIQTLAFVARHGYLLLFFWVLCEQGAIPLPSIPMLLAAGALIRAGRLNPLLALACCLAAALIADTFWFQLGRRRGPGVLRLLCRVSLEPDSCVRRTEDVFLKYGLNSLLVSKFVPGLNAVAAPLAGNSGRSFARFLVFDSVGTLIWLASYLGIGCLFSDQLEMALAYASRMGSGLGALVAGLFVLWIAWKFFQRRRFLKGLAITRITAEELRDRLEAGENPFVVDLRSDLHNTPSPIPGAMRISLEDLTSRIQEIPRDREIILFCS
jgi:membrane protein DedA with SNARE-associated domain